MRLRRCSHDDGGPSPDLLLARIVSLLRAAGCMSSLSVSSCPQSVRTAPASLQAQHGCHQRRARARSCLRHGGRGAATVAKLAGGASPERKARLPTPPLDCRRSPGSRTSRHARVRRKEQRSNPRSAPRAAPERQHNSTPTPCARPSLHTPCRLQAAPCGGRQDGLRDLRSLR